MIFNCTKHVVGWYSSVAHNPRKITRQLQLAFS